MSSVVIAVLAVAVYLLVVAPIRRRNGVRYDALAESRDSVIRGIVVPMGVGRSCWPESPRCSAGGGRRSPGSRSGPTWALVVPVATS